MSGKSIYTMVLAHCGFVFFPCKSLRFFCWCCCCSYIKNIYLTWIKFRVDLISRLFLLFLAIDHCYIKMERLKTVKLNPREILSTLGSLFNDLSVVLRILLWYSLQVCRDINRMKISMETGETVIMLNMEQLYESLYDALNQVILWINLSYTSLQFSS